jgi:hypothetical protein
MREFKAGELNIGRSEKKVKSRKQAIAIMLDLERRAKTKKKSDSYWESFEEHLDSKEDPCWEGYEQYGMKKKKGKKVPNCVCKNCKKKSDG